MYNQYPYFMNNERIDNEIRRLEEIKQKNQQYQPIQNIINTTPSNLEFEARILNENENPDEIIIQRRTAFISPKNGYLKIKELNGDITEYNLIKPKTEQELKIEELERKLEEYEHKFDSTNNEVTQHGTISITDDESTTKTGGRSISKKSQ